MQACTLPDTSLSFLREINIKLSEWEETFASQIQLAEQHLSSRLQAELRQRIPDAYSRAGKQYVKHITSYQLLPFSLASLSEPLAPAFTRALICVFFPALACAHGLQAVLAPDRLQKASGALLLTGQQLMHCCLRPQPRQFIQRCPLL